MEDLSLLLGGQLLTLGAGATILTAIWRELCPRLWGSALGRRLLPLAPIAFAVAGSFAGLGSAGGWTSRLASGVLAGAIAAHGFKIGRTTLLGFGLDAPSDRQGVEP
ncbi:hypothetical protein [Vulgatibacter incomptus]|uniref:Uncharacterized protein n=1 Tax=Vulgatibacter incomptus TaxID=1391653 RepID=A0A0K1PHG3_9BACT|nr:hypothetical protein [Vulgatibacter incomptus]AKU92960.1 hypothetical protein AKJ08_3347 [Vulgatibacter incomptus]